jgi:pyruvate/2-oxoglutarate dehydrogenase complex dihydrolipoamide acyltransferase (E2) component
MKVEVCLPKLGLTMESGIIVRYYKTVGESVQKNETILDFETDKAVSSLESPVTGRIIEIFVHEEEEIAVATPLCIIETTEQ